MLWLSAAEVKATIESAFAPYRCGVGIEEINDKVSSKVYRDRDDNDGTSPVQLFDGAHVDGSSIGIG